MKKLFLCVALVMSSLMATAQDAVENLQKKFLFVYIAHDSQTDIEKLCKRLRNYYEESTIYKGNVTVFYLANENNPITVEINTPNDNRDDFDKMIGELQNQNSHAVYPIADIKHIVSLFEKLALVAEDGVTLKYDTADWFFYVTSRFWESGYNEELVARLCFIMGTENWDMYKFQMKFYYPEYDNLNADPEYPFGKKNYGNINNAFYNYTY